MQTTRNVRWQIGCAVLASSVVGLLPIWVYSLIWLGAVDTWLEKNVISTLGALMFAIYQVASWFSLCAVWDRKVDLGPQWLLRLSPRFTATVSSTLDGLTSKVAIALFALLIIFELRVWLH